MTLTRDRKKLLDAASAIRLSPDKEEAAFIARQLVQATLPHKNPGDVPAWTRKNGNLTLTVRPGWDTRKSAPIGYPYGTVPRLLLFWITTEALRTKSPRLQLGNSLTAFMREIGLNPDNGGTGAKRSDARKSCTSKANTPALSQRCPCWYTVYQGGKSCGIMRHCEPVRTIQRKPLKTSRNA